MKILIIDDTEYKIEAISTVLSDMGLLDGLEVARTFQTGISSLIRLRPDLTILDMTLPTSEGPDGELEGRARNFGGRDILAEIEDEEIKTKVIIVTQFDRFPTGGKPVELEDLIKELKRKYASSLDCCIYFNNLDSTWQFQLRDAIKRITGGVS